ncbi:MAG: 50S ribosomal protein L17 [Candidatus Latescibacteria bacterium]|nr:50S ribosomal protein L17 [Candidatus Latescibacterota bacterium]
MRHGKDHRKLGRTASHRYAMMRSMVTSLFAAERITTTAPKAKEARRMAERLITRAKKGHRAHKEGATGVALAHWREAGRVVRSPEVLRKLFDQLAPLYMERNGGYTRIIRLDHTRVGDNARMVMLELVDSEISKKPLIRGEATETQGEADAKSAKGSRGKKKEAAAETKPKKEKKAKPPKVAKEAKPAKTKADTKKKDSGAKRSAPKKSG